MKKKRILVITMIISFLTILLGSYFLFNGSKIQAAESGRIQDFTNPDVHLVDQNNPGAASPIPGEYASMFRVTPRLSYTANKMYSDQGRYYRIRPADVDGTNYVQANKIALYQGKYIDLRMTIESYTTTSSQTGTYAYIWKVTSSSSNADKRDSLLQIDTRGANGVMKVRYDFFESGTTNKVDYKGMWNVKRLNSYKSLSIDTDPNFLKGMYTFTDSILTYNRNDTTATFTSNRTGADRMDQRFTYLFDSGGTLRHTITLNSGQTVGYLRYDTEAITRIILPAPEIIGETSEDPTKIEYTAVQDMPMQSNSSWYPTSYEMYLNADEIFDLSTGNVTVTDMNGTNVTSKFTITKDSANNRFKVTVPSSTLSNSTFVDNSYEFTVTGNVKEGVDKEKYYQSDGYLHIPMTTYNVTTPDGESAYNSANAKTKLGGQPTGTAIPQEVMLGSGTADLDPTKLVKDLKGVFASESVSVVGFEAEKTFSSLGSDTVVITIKGNKTGLLGKITVPITVINYNNPAISTKILSEIQQTDGSWLAGTEGIPEDVVRFTVTSEITNDVSRWTSPKLVSTVDSLYENITPISAQVVTGGKITSLAMPTVSGNVIQTQENAPMLANKGSSIQMVYTAQVKKATTASKNLVTTVNTVGINPDKSNISTETKHTLSVKDVEPPTAKSKVTPVALNDTEAIVGENVDLKTFLADVADNVSSVDKIKAELLAGQDIATLVSTVGVKEISIRLTDEAGNAATFKTQIFVYDNDWPVGKKGAVTGQDFVIDQKDWASDTARDTVVTQGKVQGFDISGETAIDVTNDPAKLVIDTSKVGTDQGKPYPITLTVNDATKTITVTFKDTIAPTGTGKMTIIDLNDAQTITKATDYSVFLSDWSDNVTEKENIKISLVPNQDIETVVSKIGKASFKVQLEDEAGNIGIVEVPIFVKDPKDETSKDKKYVLSGHDFSVAAVDYPTSEEAIIQMIRDKGKVKLYETESGEELLVDEVQITKDALPSPNSGTTIAPAGNYEVILSYGSGDSSVTKKIVVTVVKSLSTITAEFLDEKGKPIIDPVKVDGTIGQTVDLSTNDAIKAAITAAEQKNYDLNQRPANETAVPVTSEGTTVQYHFKGMLMIKSKPTMLDFGTKSVGNAVTKIDKATYDTPLVIWDNRATPTSWTLTAQLEDSLRSQVDTTKILPDAIRYKVDDTNTIPLSVGTAQPVMVHTHDAAGEYNISSEWDKGETGFQLEIPAGGVRKLGEYQTTILWQLGETP